jgi:hypothetical protein
MNTPPDIVASVTREKSYGMLKVANYSVPIVRER